MELTATQKRVLLALNAYPDYNDRELAGVLQMKRSTVTAARLFLERDGYYQLSLFPDFQKLGSTIMGIIYGEYGKIHASSYDDRMKASPQELNIPEYVFSLSCEEMGMSMCIADSFHVLKEPFDHWRAFFKKRDYSTNIHTIYYPLPQLEAFRFMNSQHYLAHILGLAPFQRKQKLRALHRLSTKEKAVLLRWLQYPSATNADLAQRIQVSRSVVGRIKQRLLESGIMTMLHLPDWKKLGVQLGTLTHLHCHASSADIAELATKQEVIFIAASRYEAIYFSLFKDYGQYQESRANRSALLRKLKLPGEEVKELFFPLAQTRFVLQPFALLQKKLG